MRDANDLYFLSCKTHLGKTYEKGEKRVSKLPTSFSIKKWNISSLQDLYDTLSNADSTNALILGAPRNDYLHNEIIHHRKEYFCDPGSRWLILDFDHRKYTGDLEGDLKRELARLPIQGGYVLQLTAGCLYDNELAYRLYYHLDKKMFLPQQKSIALFLGADGALYQPSKFIFISDPLGTAPYTGDRWYLRLGADVDTEHRLLIDCGKAYNLEIQTAWSIDAIRSSTEGNRRTTLNNETLTLAGLYKTYKKDIRKIGAELIDAGIECGLSVKEIEETVENAIRDGSEKPIGRAPTERDIVRQLVLNNNEIKLFRTKDEVPYILYRGKTEVIERNNEAVTTLLTELYLNAMDNLLPTSGGVVDALKGLLVDANLVTKQTRVYSAWHNNQLIIDLGEGRLWNCATKSLLEEDVPFTFLRNRRKGVLPIPSPDGVIEGIHFWELLMDLFPTIPQDDAQLIEGWATGALVPDIDYPMLLLYGPEGSGKTMLARTLKYCLDPNTNEFVRQSLTWDKNKLDDFIITADRQRITVLDNVGYLNKEQQELLCSLSTGNEISKRKLYTDGELISFSLRRPLIITTVHKNIATNADLVSRSVKVELPYIERNKYIEQSEILKKIEYFKDALLACILNRTYKKDGNVSFTRFGDFVRYAGRIYLFERNGKKVRLEYVEEDSVATAIDNLLARTPPNEHGNIEWKGTINKLFAQLSNNRPAGEVDDKWPRNTKAFGHKLYTLKRTMIESLNISIRSYRSHGETLYTLRRDIEAEKREMHKSVASLFDAESNKSE